MRTLLDARNHLEKALVHRLLDVVAPAGACHAGDAVIQDGGDGRLRILRERDHLLEVTRAQGRHEFVPQAAIADGLARQIDVTRDGDRYADHENQGQRVEEETAVLEEIDDRIEEIHLRAPKDTHPLCTWNLTRFG